MTTGIQKMCPKSRLQITILWAWVFYMILGVSSVEPAKCIFTSSVLPQAAAAAPY